MQPEEDLWNRLLDEELGFSRPSRAYSARPTPASKNRPGEITDSPRWGERRLEVIGGGAVSLPETPSTHEGVTREGQNPDSQLTTQATQELDEALSLLSVANFPRSGRLAETCGCGDRSRNGSTYCDTCDPGKNAPTPAERLIQHWIDLGEPDEPTYAARFGCKCLCHKAAPIAAWARASLAAASDASPGPRGDAASPGPRGDAASPGAGTSLTTARVAGVLGTLRFGLTLFAVDLAKTLRRLPCQCPGSPLSLAFPPLEPRPFEHERLALEVAQELDERRTDPVACAQWKARAAVSCLSTRVVADKLGRARSPGILPPLDPIPEPQGPPRWAPITWCACECHEERTPCACACHVADCCLTDDGRKEHRERALLFAGCRCREHDPQACSTRQAKGRPHRCDCPEPGPGSRRPKQLPRTAEKKARRSCARATPPPPAIPAPCSCTCHVEGCCRVAESSERRPHAEASARSLFGSCACTEHEPGACSMRRAGPRVLATKVDTLHLSWHLTLSPEFIAELKARLAEARSAEGREFVTVKLPGSDVVWRLHPTGAGRWFSFRLSNEYADLLISTIKKEEAVQARFEVRAAFLWERELEGAWMWCAEMAHNLNTGPRCARSALTRLDMAVDVTGIDFANAIRDDFVARARRRTRHNGRRLPGETCPSCEGDGTCHGCHGTGHVAAGALEDERTHDEHASGLKVSGFSFGHSGIVARIYDKTREIKEKAKDKKWLYLVWAEKGWVSTETVWRVEIQIRREVLQELVSERTMSKLAIDTLKGLRESLGSLWGYAVGGLRGHTAWLKWCVPSVEDARRSRWDARPEWKVIQGVDWLRSEPYELVRERVRDSRFNVLLPQWVGLTRAMAAISGPAKTRREVRRKDNGTREEVEVFFEPLPGEFERHLLGYVTRKRATGSGANEVNTDLWAEWIEEARVERRHDAAKVRTRRERDAALERAAAERREKRARNLAPAY